MPSRRIHVGLTLLVGIVLSAFRVVAAGVFLTVLLWPNYLLADRIPGTAYLGPQYYFSTDMDAVTVSLWPNVRAKSSPDPFARFNIPRAYIYFAPGYSQERRQGHSTNLRIYKELPPNIEVENLHVMLTYPDGKPYSIALREEQQLNGVSEREAARELRKVSFVAQIRPTSNAHSLSYLRPDSEMTKFEKYLGEYEGMKRYNVGGSIEYYYDEKDSDLRKIQCYRKPEDANPDFYCKYYVVISNNLISSVDFLDFRAHGGIGFARERIRAFKAAMCRYLVVST